MKGEADEGHGDVARLVVAAGGCCGRSVRCGCAGNGWEAANIPLARVWRVVLCFAWSGGIREEGVFTTFGVWGRWWG